MRPMSKPLTTLALAIFVTSCAPVPKREPIKHTTAPPADAAVEEPPPMSAYDAAVAEVARLQAVADQDPLLQAWTGPYGGVPPWDRLDAAKFPAAFTAGLALLDAEIEAIAENPAAPTFDNTFVPYQDAGRYEDRAEILFSVMTSSLKTEAVQAVDREWAPKISAAYDEITFNDKLFARIAAVYDARTTSSLNDEQQRLVDLTYQRFVQAGAKLTPEQKATMSQINQELAVLFTDFESKVTNDENTWTVIETEADLAGVAPDLRAAYKAAAEERGLTGKWAVVNTRSSVDPFLTQSSRRDLREKVWKAFKNRGDNGDANDTNALITRIVELRAQRAALLGYPTHAHRRMWDSMAGDPAKAEELMLRVWPSAVARVKEEVKDMQKLARKEKGNKKLTIEPWDYLFYAEKVRKQKYDLDQASLKPYFQLENMIAGSFYMAGQLYGLQFTEITGTLAVFHPDVRVWEVTDAEGKHVGVFYGDYFARAEKRSGAWASGYRGHETFKGKRTAITSNNNNFVRGAKDAPVLISLDDAQTLFHEFGHALHGLLSEVNYPGLSGTPRDFVEYPSQVHEMWVLTKPILDQFCKHVDTGKPLPQAMIAKIEKSSKFNQGYDTVEYLASAIVDMKLHTKADGVVDADAFERDTMAEIGAPKEVAMRHRLPHFLHLFSSDAYSAGYYSYLWSQVMDADTREAFVEAGDVFDKTVADKMRKFILAPGNSTDRAEAYRQFRGRDPDVKALLKLRGFPAK